MGRCAPPVEGTTIMVPAGLAARAGRARIRRTPDCSTSATIAPFIVTLSRPDPAKSGSEVHGSSPRMRVWCMAEATLRASDSDRSPVGRRLDVVARERALITPTSGARPAAPRLAGARRPAGHEDAAVRRTGAAATSTSAAGRLHAATACRPTSRTTEPKLFAFDKKTGAVVAEIELPGNATGGRRLLSNGRQFIVVPIGGANIPAGSWHWRCRDLLDLASPSK